MKRTEALAKARTRDSMSAFSKLTDRVNGNAQIVDQSPLIVPLRVLVPGDEHDAVFAWLHSLIRALPRSRSSTTGASCSRSSSWPTSRARLSASEAWGRAPGSR